jgi:hypothetical protein
MALAGPVGLVVATPEEANLAPLGPNENVAEVALRAPQSRGPPSIPRLIPI